MRPWVSSLTALVVLQFLMDCKAQSCLQASNGNRPLPDFVRDGDHFKIQPIQAIITSYRFNCCGVITEWAAHVERSGGGGGFNNGYYTITFQVWRPNSPSPVDNDGCYTLVGDNLFRDIVLDSDRAVRETPSDNDRIEVQPGDVVGFYLTTILDEDFNGIRFAEDYTQESVWYATSNVVSGSNPSCIFPVGESRTLSSFTNLAPRITAAVSMSNCPRSTSVIVMLTTDTPRLSPRPTPTPSYTTTTRVVAMVTDSPIPTTEGQSTIEHTLGTDSQIPGNTSTGLIAGIAIPVFVVGLILVLVIVVLLIWRTKKRKLQQTHENVVSYQLAVNKATDQTNQTEQEPFYDIADSSINLSTSKNEAYGEVNPTTKVPQFNVKDPPTLQNVAYATSTITNNDSDYYVNEGLNDPGISTTKNEAYGDIGGQSSSSRVTGSLDDTSIPTTRNEAYTSVSTNTERVDTEETYDYIRNL